jgi:hypothetical protein
MDIDELRPGANFADEIRRAAEAARVMLVLIGPGWLGEAEGEEQRITDPGDFVHLEVASGLAAPETLVIPLLIDGSEFPAPAELPDDLKELSRHQALEVSDARWDLDLERLLEALRKAP